MESNVQGIKSLSYKAVKEFLIKKGNLISFYDLNVLNELESLLKTIYPNYTLNLLVDLLEIAKKKGFQHKFGDSPSALALEIADVFRKVGFSRKAFEEYGAYQFWKSVQKRIELSNR